MKIGDKVRPKNDAQIIDGAGEVIGYNPNEA